jgi:hypothetical protein
MRKLAVDFLNYPRNWRGLLMYRIFMVYDS